MYYVEVVKDKFKDYKSISRTKSLGLGKKSLEKRLKSSIVLYNVRG
jgi:hypothetical protein